MRRKCIRAHLSIRLCAAEGALGGVFLISRSVPGPEGQRRRAGGRKQKQENRGPEGGPGPQGSSGLVPRWGEGGGRDGSVGRPDGRRAPSVGLTNGAVGAVGVGCTVAWAAKMHALSLVLRGFGYEIAPAARCFCFPNRGPGPSDGAGGRPLTERSKTLGPRPQRPLCRSLASSSWSWAPSRLACPWCYL